MSRFPVEWEFIVSRHMLKLGVPAHLKGYTYLRTALIMTIDDPEVVCSVTKLLYPDIAKMYHTTSQKIERAIRNAIEVSWERGDDILFEEIFGYSRESGHNRPTNSEYIATVSDYINHYQGGMRKQKD